MKQFFLPVLLIFGISAISHAQQKNYHPIVMGFYNLENFYDTINQPDVNDEDFTPAGQNHYTAEVFLDKVQKLSDVLSQIGTDITPDGLAFFGCAEIENPTCLETLVASEKLKNRNYQVVEYNSPDLRGIDVGFVYNPKYFKVIHSEPLKVNLTDNGQPKYTRDVLWVKGILDGDTVHVFVNHWPSRRGGEEGSQQFRNIAAAVPKKVVDSLMKINPLTKVFIMGDLNDDPVSPSVAKILNSKGNMQDVAPGGLYNPWVDFYKKGLGTLAYQDAWNLFDQIMLSYGFLDKTQSGYFFQKAAIFSKEFMVQKTGNWAGYPKRTFDGALYIGGYSDHFPTYIELLKEVK